MSRRISALCIGMAVFGMGTMKSVSASGLGSNLPMLGDGPTASIYNAMGYKALSRGDVPVAKADFDSALEVCPFNEESTLGLARCAEADGDFQGAVTKYRHIIDLNAYNTNVDLETEYIFALQRADQIMEAITRYNHVLDFSKKGYGIIKMEIYPANFRADGSDYDPVQMAAMTHLMRALDTGYQDPARRSWEMDQARQLAPKSSLIYFYEGVVLQKTDKPGARQALEQALALDHGANAAVITKWLNLARN